jgi:acyl transferase domain-containing protein/NAD(P)-dependent dehydrogenase (short-subunit alcohol dehydrogenase family)
VRSVFESVLGADHPIIDNHRVQQRPVLPGLAYIDMLYQLAGQGLQIDFRDYALQRLSLLQPLIIDAGAPLRLRIIFEGGADAWDIQVEGREEGSSGAYRLYVTARLSRIRFASTRNIDVEALKRAATRQVDMASIYAGAATRGLVHGGLIRARGEIFIGEHGCLVELTAEREQGPHGLVFHPAIIDGAAMACEALRQGEDASLYLPLYYESFSCSESLGTQCFALVETESLRSVNDILSVDISFYDAAGRQVAVLSRMTSKRVRPEAPLGRQNESFAAPTSTQTSSRPTSTDAEARIRAELCRILERHLGVPAAQIDPGIGFFALGMQSAQLLTILKDIESNFAQRFSPTLLFEYGNVDEIAQHLCERGVTLPTRAAAPNTETAVAMERAYSFHAKDPLVRDHLVQGVPALMGVAHPCMALHFALTSNARTLPMALEQIVFSGGPITVQERVDVRVRLFERSTSLHFQTSHTPAGAVDARICCTGYFAAPEETAPACVDIASLIASAPALSKAEQARLYAGVASFTLGPALRTVVEAYAPDASTLIMRISLSEKASRVQPGEPFALDPLLLNTCYYLQPGADQVSHERMVVPLAIERVTVFGSLPADVVIVTTVRRRHAGFVAFDASIYGEHGECLARVENASLKEVADPSALVNARLPGVATTGQASAIRTNNERRALDIAIVGLAGRYPRADDIEALWHNLSAGRDCITEIPAERWNWRDYCDSPGTAQAPVRSRWGGFIDGVDQFAPLFFGISPREANGMDPQERLFLEHCWLALEDAGYTRDGLCKAVGSRQIGVYAGVMSQEYPLFAAESSLRGESIGLPTGTGSVANRVSFYCDFRGPSISLDTMCSSSLTAIVMACEALREGRIDAALAGGVNVSIHPNKYLMLSQGGFISSKGHCEAFGAGGDGYIPGEGVGVAVLKRLEDAQRDGDHIYGVIKGAAMGHGGRTGGYTVPSPRAQAEVIARAWRDAGVDVRLAGYIEAHGTGTSLGDPIEINGLAMVFAERAPRKQFCAVGSIKSNLGHCESAAGIAGLTKVLLQMRHGQLAPSLHSSLLNPHIDFANSPFYVPQTLGDWPRPLVDGDDSTLERARLAGLSSFGAGGANAHLVIEEYVAPPAIEACNQSPVLIVLSAKSTEELTASVERLHATLGSGIYTESDLPRIAYTLQVGREAMAKRLAVVAESLAQLRQRLQSCSRPPHSGMDGVFLGGPGGDWRILARVTDDEDMAQTIVSWARKGKYERLAELWVAGANIDWSLLYGSQRPQRIGLPGYPFVRERCWIDTKPTTFDAPTAQSQIVESVRQDERDVDVVLLFEQQWIPARSTTAAIDVRTGTQDRCHLCLITDARDQSEFARAVLALEPHSRLIFIEQAGPQSAPSSPDHYAVDWNDRGSFERMFSRISKSVSSVDSLLYLWPLEDRSAVSDALPLLSCLQGLAASQLPVGKILLVGEFSDGDSLERCHLESWIGLARSMRFVLRDIAIGTVLRRLQNVADESSATRWGDWVSRLWSELEQRDSDAVLYDEDVRHELTLQPLAPLAESALPLKQRGTYVIAGGLGALGFSIARYLSHTVNANLILIGRAPLDATRSNALDELHVAGGRAVYLQSDLADLPGLRLQMQEVQNDFGDIHGIVHAAGSVSDTPFGQRTPAEFARTLAPKISGTLALDEALRTQPLDFACYFSSTSAVLGDFGSGDYALANRFQLAYAAQRERLGLPGRSIAIAWPLWANGGMDVGPEQMRTMYLKASGQRELATDEGIALLCKLLTHGATQPVVLAGRRKRIMAAIEQVSQQCAPAVTLPIATATRRTDMQGLSLQQCVEWDLKQAVSELLHIPRQKVDLQTNLADFGFDSLTLRQFAVRLRELLGQPFAPTLFFSYPSLGTLAGYFIGQHAEALQRLYAANDITSELRPEQIAPVRERGAVAQKRTASSADAIAIIGMSGRFPAAHDVDEMWEVLAQGRDAVTEVPAERFDWRRIYASDAMPGDGKTNCKWSGVIDGAAQLDALFFGISPRDAAAIDPRQRLILQEGYKALEDAAQGAAQLQRGRVGMFVGAEQGGYGDAAAEKETITANHDAILGARLAHFLDLSGPVMTLNTACSSGLVAAHQACMSLRNGECDTAIAAAVNLLLTPESFIGMSRAGMLSPDGRCHAFSHDANGMVPGEAVVVVVLKRLADAEADGDPIRAVVRGSGINYDGRTNGITAPSGLAQKRLLTSIYEHHGIHADEIGYVIAHGTGTPLGDPVEINAMCEAFRAQTERRGYCALTSTKTNFGHTFAASGLVSLVSLVQALRHRMLPPSLHCSQPSDLVSWAESPFYVNVEAAPWRTLQGATRVGAVSAFGMSGTNAHMVLQEYAVPVATGFADSTYLLAFSAKQPQSLLRKAQDLATFLRSGSPVGLAAISHTLLNGRMHFRCRCALVVRDVQHAIELLGQIGGAEQRTGTFVGDVMRDFVPTNALQSYGEGLLANADMLRTDSRKWDDALYALADLYRQGYDLEWTHLFGKHAPRRANLPTYPFATDHYWTERAATTEPAVPSAVAVENAQAVGQSDSAADTVPRLIADQLGLSLAQIDPDAPLDEYGLDSIGAAVLISRIRRLLPTVIETLFLEHATLKAIRRHLETTHAVELAALGAKASLAISVPRQAPPIESTGLSNTGNDVRVDSTRIAVIGIAVQLPGVTSIEEFWSRLTSNQPVTGPMPQRRRQLLGLPAGNAPAYYGGYLDGVEFFDHERFKLSHADAKAMDPQMRKLLEAVWLAIADAGYALPEFKKQRTALYVAVRGASGYRDIPAHLRNGGSALGEVEGGGLSANRISNMLDLRGPSQSVDTGCSSFLVAISHAMADLRDGRCTQAVVATAQMVLSPGEYASEESFTLRTKTDSTRSFARDSDGYVRSEVCGAVVLKREAAALMEGDAVYCTLRGIGVHHGGKSPLRWYSPNVEGQKTAIKEALQHAGINPDSVDYVEAEANGSQLGDASEIVALQSVYAPSARDTPLAISSLKPVFGHAEAGATFPALLKVILALRECRIPGMVGLRELNESIQLTPDCEILRSDRLWRRRAGHPRIAAVHSLALGGVNAHLIVEEPTQATPALTSQRDQVLLFSDRSPELLQQTVARWLEYVESPGAADLDIAAVAHTLQVGRSAEKHRLAVIVASIEATRRLLRTWLEGSDAGSDRLFVGRAGGNAPLPVAQETSGLEDLARAWVAGQQVGWAAKRNTAEEGVQRRAHLPANALKRIYCWHDEIGAQADPSSAGVLLMRPQWVTRPYQMASADASRPTRIVFCGWPEHRGSELGAGLDVAATLSAEAGTAVQRFVNHSKDVFRLVKHWLGSGDAARYGMQIVIPNGLENVCLHGLVGLIRTARREHSQFMGQVIVLDHKISAIQCRASLAQDAQHPRDVYVQHINGERWVQSWRELNADALLRPTSAVAGFSKKAEPVVLITGGAGALGITMAQRLLTEQPRAIVFLAGRSALNVEQERLLEELHARQHNIRYLRADVSDESQVRALIGEIRGTVGDCTAILHCAGAIRDAHIIHKSVEDLDAVLRPKVAGLWNLDDATRDMDLECFVTFSSVAAIFGNAGQADYSMANAFMDAFAAYRNQLVRFGMRRGRTLSINWPLWQGGGMRVSDAAVAAMARRYNMQPLPNELGARIALGCLAAHETNIAVTYGEAEKLRRDLVLT